ncbi:hypothetical protein FE249_18615 (plasmid) [Acidiphilium multivorum]|uniref:hypothetical protein n=1 Tax=Acidiphilium TaxID=522 RepID=UPI00157B2960|nr:MULTISPECIES: hypothetical protein [Acidiphilium]UNC16238.1 hypothetical protein FE249_18615 [Acidiphilium multivorum]
MTIRIFVFAALLVAPAAARAQMIDPVPPPQISSADQAKLFAFRMETACERGAKFAEKPQGKGVCHCVGAQVYKDALDGDYYGKWDIAVKSLALAMDKQILRIPLDRQGRAFAVANAEMPYFAVAIYEDQYDQSCGGSHGYFRMVAAGS